MHLAFLVRHLEERPGQTLLLPCPGGGGGSLGDWFTASISHVFAVYAQASVPPTPLVKGFVLASVVVFILSFIPPLLTLQPPLEGGTALLGQGDLRRQIQTRCRSTNGSGHRIKVANEN